MNNPFAGNTYVEERRCSRTIFSSRAACNLSHHLAQFRRSAVLAAALGLIAPFSALAQNSVVPARVTDRVDASQLTVLQGSTHPLAQAKYDQGAAPPNLPMNRIMLLLKRSSDQEAALQDLLTQQQVQSSANFHKWLTPDQFGQQFGPADADIQAVTSWLASFGFQSIKVSRGRTVIEFSGTASQVQTALHTPIHQYVVNGEAHWANANDPQIPAALAPVVAGFASLHNFPKRPTAVRSGQTAALTRTPGGKPQINFKDGSHGVTPADFNTIYNVAASMTGSNVTIGVVARSNIIPQDVADFRTTLGLPTNPPNIILNGPDPGDAGGSEEAEAVLDATWSGAVAPAATVDLVVSEATAAAAGEDLSEFYIIDNNLADVMTESFSVCERGFGSSLSSAVSFYSGMAEQAAAQGITYVVSSGDSGPDSCDNNANTVPATLQTASVNLLAATPFTTAVGGTEFHDCDPLPTCNDTSTTYWNSTNNATTLGSAKGYIPENVWNESCTVAQCGSSLTGLWSSGGGQSLVIAMPTWQAGVTGIPAGNRSVPDVSLASANHNGYVLCLDASCQGSNPGFAILSGTSASAQVFGGVMALVVQQMGGRVGLANYVLYNLASKETYSSCNGSGTPVLVLTTDSCVFNDVTLGNTNIPLVNPLETGFSAGTAYDEATGLGSVNVSLLVNSWSTAIVKATTTALTLNGGTAVNVTHGASVPVNIKVTPVVSTTPEPTGDVSLIANSLTDKGVDGFTLMHGFTLTQGTTNSTVSSTTTLLPGGTYQVHAHYAGDSTFLGSDSTTPTTVTVNPEASRTSLGLVLFNGSTCTTPTSVTYGSGYVLTVVVADVNAGSLPCSPNETGSTPTGIVSVTDAFNGGAAAPLDGGSFTLNGVGEFEDQTIQLVPGTHNIQASYPGDKSFSASNTTAPTVTVTKATTTTSAAANPSAAATGANVVLTATISTNSLAIANASQEPSGTVQFLVNGVAFGSPVAVVGGTDPTGTFAQSTATLSTTTLAMGQDKITAQYSGDGNYLASSTTSSATVNVGTSGINISTGCSATITISAPGQSGSCLIVVTGANGFAGTVVLSSAVASSPANAVDIPTCTFGAPDLNFTAPATITLSAASATGNATMTCASKAASHLLPRPSSRPFGRGWPMAGAGLALICIFFLMTAQMERRWRLVPIATLLVIVAVAGVGCSGNYGSRSTHSPGTTTGTYTFTLTATPSTGSAVATTITVNVQ